jgi:hypothetical protein
MDNCLILMVAPNGDRSRNSSSGYPTIGRSETSDVQTPSTGLVQNLNSDFNAVRVQAIMETIKRMLPDGSPLALLAQQGAEAANLIVAEKSATTIRQGVPEVKSRLQLVQISIYPRMMHADASHRTAMRGNMAVIGMISATLTKIGGTSRTKHQVHHNDS